MDEPGGGEDDQRLGRGTHGRVHAQRDEPPSGPLQARHGINERERRDAPHEQTAAAGGISEAARRIEAVKRRVRRRIMTAQADRERAEAAAQPGTSEAEAADKDGGRCASHAAQANDAEVAGTAPRDSGSTAGPIGVEVLRRRLSTKTPAPRREAVEEPAAKMARTAAAGEEAGAGGSASSGAPQHLPTARPFSEEVDRGVSIPSHKRRRATGTTTSSTTTSS